MSNEFSYDNSTEKYGSGQDHSRWIYYPAVWMQGDVTVFANKIVDYVKDMAMVPPNSGVPSTPD